MNRPTDALHVGLALAACGCQQDQSLWPPPCALEYETSVGLDEATPYGTARDLVASLIAVGPLQAELHGGGPVPPTVTVQDSLTLGFAPERASRIGYVDLEDANPYGLVCPRGENLRVEGWLTATGQGGFSAAGAASLHFSSPDSLDAWVVTDVLPMAWTGPDAGVYAEILADHSCHGDPWTGLFASFSSGESGALLDGLRLRDGWAVGLQGTCDNPNSQRTAAVLSGLATPAP